MSRVRFWVVTPCGRIGGYEHFEGKYRLNLHPEDGGDTFLRNSLFNINLPTLSGDATDYG